MEVVVKEELEEHEHLAPLDCIVARIKKEIEEDFAINEALLYDEDTSGDEEDSVDGVHVKREPGLLGCEDGSIGSLETKNKMKVELSETEAMELEGTEEADNHHRRSLSMDITCRSESSFSSVIPNSKDLAEELSKICPVPTLVEKPMALSEKRENIGRNMSMCSRSLARNNRHWWKPKSRRWLFMKKGEDLRGKIKGRWTALDSIPRRKDQVDRSCFKEEGTTSGTFRRVDGENLSQRGWRKRDFSSRLDTKERVRSEGYRLPSENGGRLPRRCSSSMRTAFGDKNKTPGGREGPPRRSFGKKDSAKKDIKKDHTRSKERRSIVDSSHQREKLIHASTSSIFATATRGTLETKTLTLDTSLGRLMQHPLVPNVFILNP